MRYQREELELEEVLIDSIERYRAEFINQGINLSINIPEDLNIIVFADPE